MRKVVAIIAEYNPFHNGHKHQIDKIREHFGEDTAIIAIMSGNYTQRAETSFADKLLRATAAVDCGVNLVLELPFPFSSASAEFFATAGVAIANKLGIVDYLSFGSELGNCDTLTEIAKNMLSEKFTAALRSAIVANEHDGLGYPALVESVYRECFSYTGESFTTSNNILALEYIKALIKSNSSIKPHTVKREGADYGETILLDGTLQSATAIRSEISSGDISALDFVPNFAKSVFHSAIINGEAPCDYGRLSPAIISFFRLNSSSDKRIQDAEGGLYNRLSRLSLKTSSITSLTELALTKKYTTARIKRAILFSYFGVTSSELRNEPYYTQVLAMDTLGKGLLKEVKKRGRIEVLTKPSATSGLDGVALDQKRLADAADSVFQLTKPKEVDGVYHLTFTPYVKR